MNKDYCDKCGTNHRPRAGCGGEFKHDPTLTRTDAMIKKINERALLEREVIDAAKKWDEAQGYYLHVTEVDGTRSNVSGAWKRLRRAVKALREFE